MYTEGTVFIKPAAHGNTIRIWNIQWKGHFESRRYVICYTSIQHSPNTPYCVMCRAAAYNPPPPTLTSHTYTPSICQYINTLFDHCSLVTFRRRNKKNRFSSNKSLTIILLIFSILKLQSGSHAQKEFLEVGPPSYVYSSKILSLL